MSFGALVGTRETARLRSIGVTSLFHSSLRRKAKEKRTLVMTPVINTYDLLTAKMSCVSRLVVALLFSMNLFATGQTTSERKTGGSGVLITIKVLNGKSGKPVWRESPNIYIDDSNENINPSTDHHGEAKLRIPASAQKIKISANWGHECRSVPPFPSYAVSEIFQKGIVTDNSCGTLTVSPIPGVLVFYERPSTWWERTWE